MATRDNGGVGTNEETLLVTGEQHTNGPYGTTPPNQNDDQESQATPKSKKKTAQTENSNLELDSTRYETMSKFYTIL